MKTADKSCVYRGYMIKHNLLRDEFNVSKDGFHITCAATLEAAKRAIDDIAGEW